MPCRRSANVIRPQRTRRAATMIGTTPAICGPRRRRPARRPIGRTAPLAARSLRTTRRQDRHEQAVGGAPALAREHPGHRRRHCRLVDAEPDAPQQRADERNAETPKEDQRREHGGDDGQWHQDDEADAVEQPAEHQRGEPAAAQRQRVEHRNPQADDDLGLREVIGDQRKIGEAEGQQRAAGTIPPEGRGICVDGLVR